MMQSEAKNRTVYPETARGSRTERVRLRGWIVNSIGSLAAAAVFVGASMASAQSVTHHYDETQDYGFAHVPDGVGESGPYAPTASSGFDPGDNPTLSMGTSSRTHSPASGSTPMRRLLGFP